SSVAPPPSSGATPSPIRNAPRADEPSCAVTWRSVAFAVVPSGMVAWSMASVEVPTSGTATDTGPSVDVTTSSKPCPAMVTSMPGSGSLSLSSTTGETQAVLPSGVQFVATSVVDAAAGAASIAALAVAAASAATPTARIRRAADAMGRSAVMCRVLRGVRGWPRGSLSGPPFSPWCSSPEQAVNRKGFASEPKCSRGLCHTWQRACHTKGSWLMVVDRGTYHGRARTRDDDGPTTLRAEGDRAGVVRGCPTGGAHPPGTRDGALRRDLTLDRTLED